MCEDYPCCGHDQGDCPDNFFWDEEELSPEEQAKADKAYYRQQEQEAYAEFLMSPYCFD
jgi:hypothetical protein